MSSLEDRLRKITGKKKNALQTKRPPCAMRQWQSLNGSSMKLKALEKRKEQLEVFLGLDDGPQRAGHGQLTQLCIRAITDAGGGLTSGEVKEAIEKIMPSMKLSSVPSTLSRAASLGRLRRDEAGRYFLA